MKFQKHAPLLLQLIRVHNSLEDLDVKFGFCNFKDLRLNADNTKFHQKIVTADESFQDGQDQIAVESFQDFATSKIFVWKTEIVAQISPIQRRLSLILAMRHQTSNLIEILEERKEENLAPRAELEAEKASPEKHLKRIQEELLHVFF